MAYSKKLNLLFIHIPKCAGTSIIEAMKKKDPTVDHGHHRWNYYVHHAILSDKPISFTIVRNPWDRVFSCYNYARLKKSYWHGEGQRWGVHSDYDIMNRYNFKDAVKMLYNNKSLLDLPEESRPNFKHNWSYQYPFIYDKQRELKVEMVLRYENIGEVEMWLEDGYDLKIEKLNPSTEGKNYKEHYDDEMIDLVSQIYSEDIKLLGYEF